MAFAVSDPNRLSSSLFRYWLQPTATAAVETPYSSSRQAAHYRHLAQGGVGVRVCRPGNRYGRGQFGVTDRRDRGETGDQERDDDTGDRLCTATRARRRSAVPTVAPTPNIVAGRCRCSASGDRMRRERPAPPHVGRRHNICSVRFRPGALMGLLVRLLRVKLSRPSPASRAGPPPSRSPSGGDPSGSANRNVDRGCP